MTGCWRTAVWLGALLVVAAPPARADTTQLWPTFTVQSPSSHPWRGTAEVQTRLVFEEDLDRFEGFNRHLLRLQGGRAVHRRAVVWFGYENTWPVENRTRREQRIWQQVDTTHPMGRRWSMATRSRLEQRFIRGADGTALRARHRVRLSRAIDGDGLWSVNAGVELLVSLNTVRLGPRRAFEQYRLMAGLQRRLGAVSLEPLYMRQQIRVRGARDESNHILTLQATYRF